jgi:ribonuclease HI
MKLKFDGASKGNPSPSGFGVLFRDDHDCISNIIARSLGYDTNNSTKLWDLIKGIQNASN